MGKEQDYRELEKELGLTKERLRFLSSVLEQSIEGIAVADLSGHLLYVNRAFATMHGYTSEELVGKHVSVFHTPDQMPSVETATRLTLDTGEFQGEIWHAHRDNSVFPAIMHNSLLRDEAGTPIGLIGTLRDINRRKQAEEALRESEERFRQIFDNMNSGVVVYESIKDGQDFIFKDFNRAAERIEQIDKKDLIGKSITQVFPGVVEFGLFEVLQRVWRTGIAEYHPASFYKDERISGWRDNYVCKLPIGQLLVIYDDITERKELEAQFLQAQKLEAIGRLAGGIAHDFNNLLTIITGYAKLALDDLIMDIPQYDMIMEILDAGQRATSLTRQLLAFSRKQLIRPEVLNLNDILKDTEKMLRRLIGEDVELISAYAPELANIEVDPGQMEQVVMNLAINARDAMPHGGKLTIETSNIYLDENYFRTHGVKNTPGSYVMLAITDDGVGMDDVTCSRIFEPFYTTKDRSKGTGLGLSTVYGIVKQNKGFVWVYSEPGHGTSFKIFLPSAQGPASPVDTRKMIPENALKGTETILLVEDDKDLRKIAQKIFQSYEYTVFSASSSDEALKISGEYDGAIHLLLTDLIMPGMNGKELAVHIESQRPKIKILYMSGYAENTITQPGILDKKMNFIQKPFLPYDLVSKARKLLDQRINRI